MNHPATHEAMMTTASPTCVQIHSQRQKERFFLFGAGSSGAERDRRLRGGGCVPISSMPLAPADRAVTAPLMRLGTVGYSTDAPACFEKNARPSRRH
jgi:hypothetical protein